jgi:carbon storage regulator
MGMLVITRKKDQITQIGNDIRVMIVEVKGEQVKLGIDAPKSVPIIREELNEHARPEKNS